MENILDVHIYWSVKLFPNFGFGSVWLIGSKVGSELYE